MPLRNWIAILPVSGVIGPRTLEVYYGILKAVERDRRVRGALLLVESPGGGATASEMLHERIAAVSAKKPVYAYCMLAASGGYMAALAARKLYAPHTAAVGSIGVLSLKPVMKELLDKIGLDLEVLKKGKMKDMGLFHRGFTDEERESMDALNGAVYERFVGLVAERRGMRGKKPLSSPRGPSIPPRKRSISGS
jgi:protease-4